MPIPRATPGTCLSCNGPTDRPFLDCAKCRMNRKFLSADERRANRAQLAAEFQKPLTRVPDRIWRHPSQPGREDEQAA